MKPELYKKIFKVLNEDLNMILSDDDFEEPEIDLGVHMRNIQNNINLLILQKNVTEAIENKDFKELKDIIENQWDGETAFYPVNNDNIKYVISFSIKALGHNANLNWIDTFNVTNMSGVFSYREFNGDISGWDVSNVTNMYEMFYYSQFNGDISGWDVSNVTDMYGMFHLSKFNEDISSWDVSKVKDMSWMFFGSPFNRDISRWDVSSVKRSLYMFDDDVKRSLYMFDDDGPIKEEYKPKFND